MLNIVMRLVTLADDIVKIRPGKDSLRILFLIIAIETLEVIKGSDKTKVVMVIDFFENNISGADKTRILENVKKSRGDKNYKPGDSLEITIEVFARIINAVRNMFVHEGDYWSFSFGDYKYPLLQSLKVEEEWKGKKIERTYEINLRYRDFRNMMVIGYIDYINEFIGISDNK